MMNCMERRQPPGDDAVAGRISSCIAGPEAEAWTAASRKSRRKVIFNRLMADHLVFLRSLQPSAHHPQTTIASVVPSAAHHHRQRGGGWPRSLEKPASGVDG